LPFPVAPETCTNFVFRRYRIKPAAYKFEKSPSRADLLLRGNSTCDVRLHPDRHVGILGAWRMTLARANGVHAPGIQQTESLPKRWVGIDELGVKGFVISRLADIRFAHGSPL